MTDTSTDPAEPPEGTASDVALPGHSWGYRFMKRILDLLASSVGLLLTSPLLLAIAGWIKLDSEGPIIYRANRIGRDGDPFEVYKFRSMVVDADRIGGPTTSDDDPRVTRAGAFIRKFKLDELPQLLNVLKGEMSLVGPRPDVPSEVAKLTPAQRAAILSVRPGMTDFASIRFNDEGEIVEGYEDPHAAYEKLIRPEKIRLQERYAREASLSTDLGILWRTFVTLFVTRAANRPQQDR